MKNRIILAIIISSLSAPSLASNFKEQEKKKQEAKAAFKKCLSIKNHNYQKLCIQDVLYYFNGKRANIVNGLNTKNHINKRRKQYEASKGKKLNW